MEVIQKNISITVQENRNYLALFGGQKVRTTKFPAYRTIGTEEEEATLRVLRSGVLSRFLGTWHEDFYGGPEVRAFEQEWAMFFGVKHAIAVNSATSGLYAAVGALDIDPGEEVIVSPYTMTASAVAPLIWSALPVFADIEENYFCLSPDSIEERISSRTRAIIVVDLFGHSYDVERINAIAKKHNLVVIEDCAQAPFATYKDKFAGTLGDIGIYSLNYHKHIHTGEGGVVVTNNDQIAEKIRMIRNHAEAVVAGSQSTNIANMIGFNFRMTEIEAAIGREQLKKLKTLVQERIKNVEYLERHLGTIPCLKMPKVRDEASHVYYLHAIKFDEQVASVPRDVFVEAVKAELMPIQLRETEGIKVGAGYVKPLYLQPLYQQKIAFGKQGHPWNLSGARLIEYTKGLCPVAEKMYEKILITHELMRPGMQQQDLDDVITAFQKVWELREELIVDAKQ